MEKSESGSRSQDLMSAAMWRVLVVMAALLAVMLPGCGRQGGDSARSGDVGRSPAPTLEQLSRASYSGIGAAPVRLSDGRFEGPPLVAGAASRQIIELLEEHVAFGDLDGDASDEAAVLLGENSGGSGSHLYLAVVAVRRGSVENLATALLGDRLQVRSLQVADRRVRIDLLEHGPGDPACCPTQPAVQEWLLRDRHVVKAGAGNGAAAGVPTYRGALVWGHESRSFRECGSPREGWVVDATGGRIREVYESLATEPYQPIYVVVRGRWLPGLTSGFAADYRERFEILDLRRAEREGFGCREDLAGIDYVAHGNEPFWRVEIRPTGVVFSAPGRVERLEFPPPGRGGEPAARLFTSEREGEPPRRIEVVVTERPCVDSMSGSLFSFAAVVRLDGATFEGCAADGW